MFNNLCYYSRYLKRFTLEKKCRCSLSLGQRKLLSLQHHNILKKWQMVIFSFWNWHKNIPTEHVLQIKRGTNLFNWSYFEKCFRNNDLLSLNSICREIILKQSIKSVYVGSISAFANNYRDSLECHVIQVIGNSSWKIISEKLCRL